MSDDRTYASATAFRQALTDRLRTVERESRWNLPQLQRQIAYDRLLERLYFVDDGWIVKGAAAPLARDIGDWFRFELAASRPSGDGSPGVRIPATAYIGATSWARFQVDLVGSDIVMTGTPDDVPPLAHVAIPDVEQNGYRAYPLVDHIADKVAAMLQRYGAQEQPSTRFRDLVDLVAMLAGADVDAAGQSVALKSEAGRRGIALPKQFDVPDREIWEAGYANEAAKSLLTRAKTLDEALVYVRPFINPLLDGTAAGRWEPKKHRWAA